MQDVPWDRVLARRVGAACHIAAAPLHGTFRAMNALHALTAGSAEQPQSADCTDAESAQQCPFVAPCALLRLRATYCGARARRLLQSLCVIVAPVSLFDSCCLGLDLYNRRGRNGKLRQPPTKAHVRSPIQCCTAKYPKNRSCTNPFQEALTQE